MSPHSPSPIHHSPLRILYLFTSPSLKGSSVQTKVLNQIKYLNLAGAECRGAFFSTEVKEVTPLNEQVDLIPVEKCEWKYFRKIGQRRILDKALYAFIQQHFANTDIFYLRYPGASIGLYKTAKKFGNKIVTEHQSKELEEIKTQSYSNSFGLKPSLFFSWLQYNKIPMFNESFYGLRFRNQIKAAVSVTKEIGNYQQSKGINKSIVISNGINVSNYRVRNISKLKDTTLIKVLYLKGGSTDVPWSGLERLIGSIKNVGTNGSFFELIIAGKPEKKFEKYPFINQTGYKTGQELEELIDNVHIGVNHLGLHKIGLYESSNIKVREYFSRGLPFINASIDEDIIGNEFVLQVPSNDEIINLELITQFARNVLSDTEHPQKMREYAEAQLDYGVKMGRLYSEVLKLQNA